MLLRNFQLILPGRVVESGNLLIENGRIAQISEATISPTGNSDSDIDGTDLTLFPGFIDLHIHGSVGIDTMDAGIADLKIVSEFLATQGVTGWLPTLVPAADENYAAPIDAIKKLMAEQEADTEFTKGARVLGVHYEGPFINESQCGALRSAYFKSFRTTADVDALPVPRQLDGVRMMTVAPEIEGGVGLIEELVRRGWIVSIGHTRADVTVLEKAFAAGARHMTHFMNAMPPFHHRAAGPVGWGLTKDEVSVDVIADGVHIDPLVLKLILRTKGAARMALISDGIAAVGMGDGDYQIWSETISVKNGRTSNAYGTIAGSVISMLDAVRMMRSLGVLDFEVAKMASTNPARLLGLERVGSIEVGNYADLVALDQQGNVRLTIVGGTLLSR